MTAKAGDHVVLVGNHPWRISDDFRPSKFHLSNSEIHATGMLCGGAVANIARELLELRKQVYSLNPPAEGE